MLDRITLHTVTVVNDHDLAEAIAAQDTAIPKATTESKDLSETADSRLKDWAARHRQEFEVTENASGRPYLLFFSYLPH